MSEQEGSTESTEPDAEKQAQPTAPSAPAPEPKPKEWKSIGILAGFAVLIIFGLWQTVALSMTRNKAASDLAAAKKVSDAAVDEARRTGGEHAAAALGAGINQMFLLRTQYPDISDRTFRAICDELAATGYFDLSMITDSHKRVIASSDQQFVGQTYDKPVTGTPTTEKLDGQWQVTAPVRSRDATLGAVILRLK